MEENMKGVESVNVTLKAETTTETKDAVHEREYSEFVKKYLWLIRPCHLYAKEESECKSLRGRFHQYFIHGSPLDCNSWSKDAILCERCWNKKNSEACAEIIHHEAERRLKRLTPHEKNDVWQKRNGPPENWNTELPNWWHENNKNSLLIQGAEEFKKYIAENRPKSHEFCAIL